MKVSGARMRRGTVRRSSQRPQSEAANSGANLPSCQSERKVADEAAVRSMDKEKAAMLRLARSRGPIR